MVRLSASCVIWIILVTCILMLATNQFRLPSSEELALNLFDLPQAFALIAQQPASASARCAINLFGLPRAFESLVLPSLERNVIGPNMSYGCDYYVHYYAQTLEPAGRSGNGGHIDPEQVRQLKTSVEAAAAKTGVTRTPQVLFISDTEEVFWTRYRTLLDKINNEVDANGKLRYFPWKSKTYRNPTTTNNIIKMWHSIEAAWTLMADSASKQGITYSRVAMLRSDVVYMTPVDIYETSNGQRDTENRIAVVPGFGRYPISDRIVYGPAAAVKIWAAERFARLEAHVDWVAENAPGWALHSERFVKHALFDAMEGDTGVAIEEHNLICFYRARVDESVWIGDCGGNTSKRTISAGIGEDQRGAIERILGRQCGTVSFTQRPRMESLDCSKKAVTSVL